MKGLIYGGSVVVVVFEKFSHSCCQEPGFCDRFAQNLSRIFKMSIKHNFETTERCDARKTMFSPLTSSHSEKRGTDCRCDGM